MSSSRIRRDLPQVVPGGDTQPHTRIEEPQRHLLGVVPVVEKDLIDHLKAVFPASLSRQHDLRTYDVMVGHSEVILYLERVWKEQNN